jgi:uncharacterized protein involved in exopolysaccharide biosynthesis
VAVSPIYLESLRSYELYASSDDLFLKAAEKFGLRRGSQPVDKLKKSVLEVGLPRNTKVLEIRVTWRDPRIAHEVALYLAEETVKLSQEVSRGGEELLIRDAEAQAAQARERASRADKALASTAGRGSTDQLKAALEADEKLRSELQLRIMYDEVDASGSASNTRLEAYRQQLRIVERQIGARSKLLAQLSTENKSLEAEYEAAQAALKSALTRLDDARFAANYRGERLRVLDPGIVPERPSFPNVPLILMVALFGGLVLALFAAALEAGLARSSVRAPLDLARRR